MKVFVTGASGWIGSATVRELIASGHDVVGLARSDAAAERVSSLGAEVVRGELADLSVLASVAAEADGVVHLGYHHDFSQMAEAADLDRAAIRTFGDALAGTDKPFLFASGVIGATDEDDRPAAGSHPRVESAALAFGLAERGVRVVAVRFAPTVHGQGDHGFVAELARVARERGVAAYTGDGSHVWPAVHVTDAARLVVLALESAPAGSAVHAVAEDGVPTREIAEAIGRGLGVPTESIAADAAVDTLGWIGMFFSRDLPASSVKTREALGWSPSGPTLLDDLEAGHYTS